VKYNLGFGHPRTDVCSRCLELTAKIQKERDSVKKSKLLAAKRVHVLRSKACYLVKEQRSNLVTLSPDQMVYSSRQLCLYIFTIVEGSSTEKLSPGSVYSYCRTEN
jgi:hypothetical protein